MAVSTASPGSVPGGVVYIHLPQTQAPGTQTQASRPAQYLLLASFAVLASMQLIIRPIVLVFGLLQHSSVSDGARPWNMSTADVHTCTP